MFVRATPTQSSSSSPPPVRLTKGAPVSSVGSFTQVGSLQPSKETGPEEESLRYSDTWDEVNKRKPPLKKAKPKEGGDPTHTLGELVITPDVLALIISWRAHQGTASSATLSPRKAVSAYRDAAQGVASNADKKSLSSEKSTLF